MSWTRNDYIEAGIMLAMLLLLGIVLAVWG
jgi:hypothetical protein